MTKDSKLDRKLIVEILSIAIAAASVIFSFLELTVQKPQVIQIEEAIIETPQDTLLASDSECDLYCDYFYF